jgi:uncharacterized RDD family membrane protein YckC
VFIGGIVVLALYLIPVVGFIVYKVLGILGIGVVVYTLLIAAQARRETALSAAAAAAPVTPAAAAAGTTVPPSSDATSADAPFTAAGPSVEPAAPRSSPADLTLPRAGFWIRMAAIFIDMVLVGVALSLLHSDGVFLLVLATYGAIMWKIRGTTVGGVVCHLKVVRVDGREIDWSTSVIRALSCFLSLALAGLGFLWIAFDPNRQAWHDKIAGTVVVRVPQGVPLV